MKSRRSSASPKLPTARRRGRRRNQEHFAKDEDKWLFPADTTTLQVALDSELIAEIDDVLDVLFPALRDRADFAYEACKFAIQSWKQGTATAEGKALLKLVQRKRRRANESTSG